MFGGEICRSEKSIPNRSKCTEIVVDVLRFTRVMNPMIFVVRDDVPERTEVKSRARMDKEAVKAKDECDHRDDFSGACGQEQ